jgi:hypothetical protein
LPRGHPYQKNQNPTILMGKKNTWVNQSL